MRRIAIVSAAIIAVGLLVGTYGWFDYYQTWKQHGRIAEAYQQYLEGKLEASADTSAMDRARDHYTEMGAGRIRSYGAYGLGGTLVVIGLVLSYKGSVNAHSSGSTN